MKRKVFFNLLLVLTIGFSACDKVNNPIDENLYTTLSQSEIVSLLSESWLKSLNAPEVRRIDTVRNVNVSVSDGIVGYRNDVRLWEINRDQKKSLEVAISSDGSIRRFNYIENLTSFSYIFESDMPESIQSRTILDGNYWNLIDYWNLMTYKSNSNGYEKFTWSVEGRVFIGVEKRERDTNIYTIKLNEKEQLISVELTDDTPLNTGVFFTFSYGSINPSFPESFNQDDFIESGTNDVDN